SRVHLKYHNLTLARHQSLSRRKAPPAGTPGKNLKNLLEISCSTSHSREKHGMIGPMFRPFFHGLLGSPVLLLLVLLLPDTREAAAQSTLANANSVTSCGPPAGWLSDRLTVWQQRLNVEDWKVSIVMSHPSDLKPKTLGNIHWDTDKKTAVIRVLFASDYTLP